MNLEKRRLGTIKVMQAVDNHPSALDRVMRKAGRPGIPAAFKMVIVWGAIAAFAMACAAGTGDCNGKPCPPKPAVIG